MWSRKFKVLFPLGVSDSWLIHVHALLQSENVFELKVLQLLLSQIQNCKLLPLPSSFLFPITILFSISFRASSPAASVSFWTLWSWSWSWSSPATSARTQLKLAIILKFNKFPGSIKKLCQIFCCLGCSNTKQCWANASSQKALKHVTSLNVWNCC